MADKTSDAIMHVEHVRDEWWRERVDPAQLRLQWAGFPGQLALLDEFVAALRPGDQLWLFDIDASVGLAIRRAGKAIKNDVFLVV
jgi:hypothetical protein